MTDCIICGEYIAHGDTVTEIPILVAHLGHVRTSDAHVKDLLHEDDLLAHIECFFEGLDIEVEEIFEDEHLTDEGRLKRNSL